MIAKNEGNDEKCNTQEYSNTSDNMDKVVNFFSNGCLSSIEAWC